MWFGFIYILIPTFFVIQENNNNKPAKENWGIKTYVLFIYI